MNAFLKVVTYISVIIGGTTVTLAEILDHSRLRHRERAMPTEEPSVDVLLNVDSSRLRATAAKQANQQPASPTSHNMSDTRVPTRALPDASIPTASLCVYMRD
jgi:hypothetical protein